MSLTSRLILKITWTASTVLHPHFKFSWFEQNWTSPGEAHTLMSMKTKLRRLWERNYKEGTAVSQASHTPEPERQGSYLENISNQLAPWNLSCPKKPTCSKEKLLLYLVEPPTDLLGVTEYWIVECSTTSACIEQRFPHLWHWATQPSWASCLRILLFHIPLANATAIFVIHSALYYSLYSLYST
jgi:hypothetical protein